MLLFLFFLAIHHGSETISYLYDTRTVVRLSWNALDPCSETLAIVLPVRIFINTVYLIIPLYYIIHILCVYERNITHFSPSLLI